MQYNGLRLTSKGYPCNNLAVYTSGHSLPSHLIILFSDISQLFIIHPFPRLHNSQLKDAVSPTLHTLYMVLFTSDTIMSEFKFVNAIDHHMYLVHYFNLCVEWIPVFLKKGHLHVQCHYSGIIIIHNFKKNVIFTIEPNPTPNSGQPANKMADGMKVPPGNWAPNPTPSPRPTPTPVPATQENQVAQRALVWTGNLEWQDTVSVT